MWLDFSYKKYLPNNKNYELSSCVNAFLKKWYSKSKFLLSMTSGSTGIPKKIFLSKNYLYQRATKTVMFFKLNKNNVKGLFCLHPNFIGSKMFLIRASIFKWKIFFVNPMSNPLKNIVNKYRFDISSMVPIQVFHCINNINIINKLLIGGSPLSNNLVKKLQNVITDCYDAYGMTETCGHIALKKINGINKSNYFKLLDNDIKIDVDHRNCLNIYFKNIDNLFIQTNDIVDLKSDKIFEWIGRYDNIINSGGIKIIPELIEKKISSLLPFNRRFFIFSIPDKILGEKIILVIEGDPFFLEFPKFFFLKKKKFWKPKEIFFFKKFEENFIGKIKKKSIIKKIIENKKKYL